MISVLISFSRITLLTFVLIFTVIDLISIFEFKISEITMGMLSTIQAVMVVLFMLNASFILYVVKDDATILLLMIGQLLLYLVIAVSLNKLTIPASKTLNNNVFMLLSFSFVVLERLSLNKALRQFIYAIFSVVIAILVVIILRKIKDIESKAFIFAALGVICLILVLILGRTENGARLSIEILGLRIQASEFVKISFLFFISGAIVLYRDIRGFIIASIGTALHVLILALSRDLGTALIFLCAYVFLTFIAYKNYIVLSLEIIFGLVGGILAYQLFPHIQSRFIAWTDPLSVVDTKGYQISQSLFAIGTAGWIGSGFTNGSPAKIPVVTMDFIFAAISEEFGAVVAICLIIMLMCTMVILFNIAYKCSDSFYMLTTCGIAIVFAIQTILNIGGVIKFIPSTGVTLPFVSYGGNSLLSMLICLYIAQCSDDLFYYE